ncbi:cyclic nucleotide-binding domain-containing protein [Dactylosporangium sp. NPDC050688]|uniref:Crp/Fnr family transcriptional regulator n=1 Tax=Dactylosporangium sp. NPDC050688 TaxID=3157217 RepID=UPI0033CE65EA
MTNFWAELTATERQAFTGGSFRRRWRRGAPLCCQGDPPDWVAALHAGHVKVSASTPDRADVVLGVCGPGALIGDVSALDGQPRSATVEALEDVEADFEVYARGVYVPGVGNSAQYTYLQPSLNPGQSQMHRYWITLGTSRPRAGRRPSTRGTSSTSGTSTTTAADPTGTRPDRRTGSGAGPPRAATAVPVPPGHQSGPGRRRVRHDMTILGLSLSAVRRCIRQIPKDVWSVGYQLCSIA